MRIPVPHGHLEANLRKPAGFPRAAAVVCHPHPLYGGTMHTKAVFRTAQALADAGIAALRFNFRGVGTSTGSYDEGIGEKDDARAALDLVEEEFPGLPLILGGFSFGSAVSLAVGVDDPRVVAMVGLGLGLESFDYSFLAGDRKPTLIIQGEDDEFGSGEAVARMLEPLGDQITLVRVPGSGHYFYDSLDVVKAAVGDYFTSGPGHRVLGPPSP